MFDVQFSGHLGRDPEFRTTTSGYEICTMSVASSLKSNKKDDEGKAIYLTEWMNVTVIGEFANKAANDFSKGSKIYVEGYCQIEQWIDKVSGEAKRKMVVVAKNLSSEIPDKKEKKGGTQLKDTGYPQQKPPTRRHQPLPNSIDELDSDVPF